jgi:tRNA pseudouridine32 synthase / 23S rRNA pseudouridine746 synthase
MAILAVKSLLMAMAIILAVWKTRSMPHYRGGVVTASAFVVSTYNTRRPRSYSRPLSVLQESGMPSIRSEEVRFRNLHQLERLRERDRQSKEIKQEVRMNKFLWTVMPRSCFSVCQCNAMQCNAIFNHTNCAFPPHFVMYFSLWPNKDLKIVFEDDHLVCVDKPSGVLCVPSEEGIPTLAQAVFEYVHHKQSSLDKMVVHRLGMDTSGLVIFAKTMEALRGLNTLFRTRQITRVYEVLVCGHVVKDSGTIDLPLMRDYVHPPYMRVSTDAHQKALMGLDPAIVGKKLLENPKPSQTLFKVISRETLFDTDLPVTRLLLTSVTGRTHQLNVHCAAIGHPIVGDRVYGLDGDAAPFGGLDPSWDNAAAGDGAASLELQKAIVTHVEGIDMCVHAKSLSFLHPILGTPLSFESQAPF